MHEKRKTKIFELEYDLKNFKCDKDLITENKLLLSSVYKLCQTVLFL